MRFDLKTSTNLQDYASSLIFMEDRVKAIGQNKASSLLWFLEYPPLFTQGRSSSKEEAQKVSFPLWQTNRGGKITYHGPGQRVVYVMIDLEQCIKDVKLFIYFLEEWIIESLSVLGVRGKRVAGRTGVWVDTEGGEKKIAALGVRLQKWITSHGVSLNVAPDLSAYNEIIPCGIEGYGVTSLKELGITTSMDIVDHILLNTFPSVFQYLMKGSINGYRKT